MSTQLTTPLVADSDLPGIVLARAPRGPRPLSEPGRLDGMVRVLLFALPLFSLFLLQFIERILDVGASLADNQGHYLIAFMIGWFVAIECSSIHRLQINREHTGAMALLKAVLAASLTAVVFLPIVKSPLPNYAFIAIVSSSYFTLSLAIMTVARTLTDPFRFSSSIAIVEMHTSKFGDSWTLSHKRISRHVIPGAVQLESLRRAHPMPRSLTTEELLDEIRKEPAQGILIAVPLSDIGAVSSRTRQFERLGTPIRLAIYDRATRPFGQDLLFNSDSVYLLNADAVPYQSWQYSILKRTFDMIFASTVLMTSFPLMVMIAFAVKANSKGSIFFTQDRVGWNGEVFRMYKFRTMSPGPAEESDTQWIPRDDSRCTATGRLLRTFSLDELPQFWNVLRGEMSVVGPRPERPFFVDSFRRQFGEYHRRHQIKAGITGWAQVNGLRGDTCIRTRLMHDLYYLQNWGLVFDLKIIARTLLCVFFKRNSH